MANITLAGPARESSWRRMAVASWSGIEDPTIYGLMELDARAMLRRIERERARGLHLTITHLVARGLAEAMARCPETNVVLRRRRVWRRESVDLFVHAALPDPSGDRGAADLAGVKIDAVETLGLADFVAASQAKLAQLRAGQDRNTGRVRASVSRTPRALLRPLLRATRWLNYELNLDLSALGVPRDPFGSAAVTSLGMLGIEAALVPLYPIGGPPVFVSVGAVRERAVVEQGQVLARPMLTLGGSFDHRVLDGYQIGGLASTLRQILEQEVEDAWQQM